MTAFGVQLPLTYDSADGFTMLKTIQRAVKQNFKMLLLTHPGERLMEPLFGIGLKKFLFDQNHESTYERIKLKINSQVSKYMPYLDILNIQFRRGTEPTDDNSVLRIRIKMFVKPLRMIELFDIIYDYQLDNLSFMSDSTSISSMTSGY